MNISRRAGFALAAFIVAGVGAFLVRANAQTPPPTEQQCLEAWGGSSAAGSCGLTYLGHNEAVITVSGGQCKIGVQCATNNSNVPQDTDFTGSRDEVSRLKNCNGTLKVDNC